MELSLRRASPADEDFIYTVYVATRRDEISPWGWPPEDAENFLRMQYRARRQSYAMSYPGCIESILLHGDSQIGTMIIGRTHSELRLIDIALLPEFRRQSFGKQAILRLIEEARAARVPARLSVARGNPAIRLYGRLGFIETSSDAMYIEMEYAT